MDTPMRESVIREQRRCRAPFCSCVTETCPEEGDAMMRENVTAAPSRLEMLEAQLRRYLDYADENDDDGGHIGWSRYYRRRADEIAAQIVAEKSRFHGEASDA